MAGSRTVFHKAAQGYLPMNHRQAGTCYAECVEECQRSSREVSVAGTQDALRIDGSIFNKYGISIVDQTRWQLFKDTIREMLSRRGYRCSV